MKIAVCIVNHNQNRIIEETLKKLKKQTQKPETIFVCSDGTPFKSEDESVVTINNEKDSGRCINRNSVVEHFLGSDCDALIFIDGDSYPKNNKFIQLYEDELDKYDLVFGTRVHKLPAKKLKKAPSDYLTANMDRLWSKQYLSTKDLRIEAGAVETWKNTELFNEKLDLMLTGMICWSCNFGITRKGLIKHLKFRKKVYGHFNLFDDEAFDGTWGYEDVAMGLDALYAGLKIDIFSDAEIVHLAHERTDGLFDHVKGRHLIMDRMRNLEKAKKVKNAIYAGMIVGFTLYIVGVITGLLTCYLELSKLF
jgi:glycosyltransferase involved in cell wall biosynthesis